MLLEINEQVKIKNDGVSTANPPAHFVFFVITASLHVTELQRRVTKSFSHILLCTTTRVHYSVELAEEDEFNTSTQDRRFK